MICDKSLEFPKFDESDLNSCVVDYCINIMDIARKESCGKSVLCREGTWQAYEIIKDIAKGNGRSDDIELLQELLQQIKRHESCGMAKEAASICLELIIAHEDEWSKHICRKICSSMICKGMYTLYIDPQICDGCGLCLKICPSNAIAGGEQMIHVIDTELCNKTLACRHVCPKEAIKKAGAVKPRISKEPIPVGSAGESSDEQNDQTTRRRRRK